MASGLYGTAFFALQPRGPESEALAEQAARLRSQLKPGEPIFLLPAYATEAREMLGDGEVWAVRHPMLQDLETRSRVWLFALFGSETRAERAFQRAGWVAQSGWNAAGIAVRAFENPSPWEVVDDLSVRVAEAEVFHLLGDGTSDRCRKVGSGTKHTCARESEWLYVAPEWHRMGEHPRHCLWAHPPGQGSLRITWTDVPGHGVLVGRGGHTLHSSRHARAPVHMAVDVHSIGQTDLVFELTDTWSPFRIPMAGTARTTTVSFTIWSEDAGANHFCFTADVRRAPEP